jgi:hypothetical protein
MFFHARGKMEKKKGLFHFEKWLNFFNRLDKSLSCQCTRWEIKGREKGKGDIKQGHTLFSLFFV